MTDGPSLFELDRRVKALEDKRVDRELFEERTLTIRGDIEEIKTGQRATRNMVASALIGLAFNIVGSIVIALLLQGGN